MGDVGYEGAVHDVPLDAVGAGRGNVGQLVADAGLVDVEHRGHDLQSEPLHAAMLAAKTVTLWRLAGVRLFPDPGTMTGC